MGGRRGGVEEHTLVLHSPLQLDNHRVPRELREERLRVDGLEGLRTSDEEGSELRGSGPEEIPLWERGECPEGGGENASMHEKIQVMPLPGAIPRRFPPLSGDSRMPWGLQVPRGGVVASLTDITQLTFASRSPAEKLQRSTLNRAHFDSGLLHRGGRG